MLSYNQIIKLNKEFASAHKVIKNFGNGERWQIVDHNQDATYKYPLMWMEDNSSSVANKEFVYSFRIWFVTRVEAPDDLEGELLYSEYAKAKSDMIQCALDLVSYWVQDTNYPSLDIDKNISVDTFIDKTKDKDTGCYFDLKFREAYNYDSCIIPMDGVTPPAVETTTITINDDTFTSVTCGADYNVVVKDTDGTVVGSKVGSEWIVPAASLGVVANSMNGSALTDAVGGTTKTFVIQDSGANPVTVTQISDSATAFVGEVPNGVGAFYYAMPQPTWMTSYNTYDEGWHNINGTYDNTVPVNGVTQQLANGDFYKVQFDAESRGHTYRFLGLNGGYYNSDDGLYYDSSHVATTRALVFDNDVYAFDRLTGIAWVLGTAGPTTLTAGIAFTQTYALHGFTNYEMPYAAQLNSIIDRSLTLPLTSSSSPVFSMPDSLKTSTPSAAAPTTTGSYTLNTGSLVTGRTYSINDRIPICRDARGQF